MLFSGSPSVSLEQLGCSDIPMRVSNPADPSRFRELQLLVDSGAIYSIVPGSILSDLGLVPDQVESFRLADLTEIQRQVGEAAFSYQDRTRVSPVVFGEEGDATFLGVITLESFALVLDPIRRELRPMALRL